MELLMDRVDSELGQILVVCDHHQLCALDFGDDEDRLKTLLNRRFGEIILRPATNPLGVSDRIRAYLAGEYDSLNGIPVNPGGAPFQQKVWSALCAIPCGEVLSYGELAAKIGQPTASRAVGMANSRNPIAIVIPCHRVIGANASLTGYAGGIERKRWLLEHEGVVLEELANRQKMRVRRQSTLPAEQSPKAPSRQLSIF
ncbi:MAG: methylated-DNA--[protein]-cysteine S-methyltransferase [Leptolyngbyaceae cyanobacterium MO_188.B28]|nr:methylated-DNA--[protein]-cysteine S-methyltransferase [Leptolyngbyaceae cyanobacterium MO_188.B28]